MQYAKPTYYVIECWLNVCNSIVREVNLQPTLCALCKLLLFVLRYNNVLELKNGINVIA